MGQPDELALLVPDLQKTDLDVLCTRDAEQQLSALSACLGECMQSAWHVSDAITARYFSHTDNADSVGA